jgi:hypothetical protein
LVEWFSGRDSKPDNSGGNTCKIPFFYEKTFLCPPFEPLTTT